MMDFLFDDFNYKKNDLNFSNIGSSILNKYRNMPMVIRDEEHLEIEMLVPGYEKEDLEINIDEQILIISGKENEDSKYITGFTRKFEIPEEVDTTKCSANIKAGILRIKFKNKERSTRNIKIN